MPNFSDLRPLSEIPFALQLPEGPEREEGAARMRDILASCGCLTADDVAALGCTGAAKFGLHVEDIISVRDNMAGSGIGLTCFVGTDRWCRVHNTVGGLQEGQKQNHPGQVEKISRELTASERVNVALIEKARRTDKVHAAKDVLVRGRGVKDLAEDDDTAYLFDDSLPIVENTEAEAGDDVEAEDRLYQEGKDLDTDAEGLRTFFHNVKIRPLDADGTATKKYVETLIRTADVPLDISRGLSLLLDVAQQSFTCDIHETLNWACQRCAAAEILKGDYEPQYLVLPAEEDNAANLDNAETLHGTDVAAHIQQLNDDTGYEAVALFVKVARWQRKLSRE